LGFCALALSLRIIAIVPKHKATTAMDEMIFFMALPPS
jgi:hypothetical protein